MINHGNSRESLVALDLSLILHVYKQISDPSLINILITLASNERNKFSIPLSKKTYSFSYQCEYHLHASTSSVMVYVGDKRVMMTHVITSACCNRASDVWEWNDGQHQNRPIVTIINSNRIFLSSFLLHSSPGRIFNPSHSSSREEQDERESTKSPRTKEKRHARNKT
ncbi:hypothetical protein P5V15_011224 [Pogonomyrmex californicus]